MIDSYLSELFNNKRVSAVFDCGIAGLGDTSTDVGKKIRKICPKAALDYRGTEILVLDRSDNLVAVIPSSKTLTLVIGQKKPYRVTRESFIVSIYLMMLLKCKVVKVYDKSIKDVDVKSVIKLIASIGCKVNTSLLKNIMK